MMAHWDSLGVDEQGCEIDVIKEMKQFTLAIISEGIELQSN